MWPFSPFWNTFLSCSLMQISSSFFFLTLHLFLLSLFSLSFSTWPVNPEILQNFGFECLFSPIPPFSQPKFSPFSKQNLHPYSFSGQKPRNHLFPLFALLIRFISKSFSILWICYFSPSPSLTPISRLAILALVTDVSISTLVIWLFSHKRVVIVIFLRCKSHLSYLSLT